MRVCTLSGIPVLFTGHSLVCIRTDGTSICGPGFDGIGDLGPVAGRNANCEVVDDTAVPITLRVDTETDNDGSPAPVEPFTCIGLDGCFNSGPTACSQIMPRSLADVLSGVHGSRHHVCSVGEVCEPLMQDEWSPCRMTPALPATRGGWYGTGASTRGPLPGAGLQVDRRRAGRSGIGYTCEGKAPGRELRFSNRWVAALEGQADEEGGHRK
jgi:hypothetical protein